MIISIHQPYYIPWMGLFHKMYVTDAIVLLDHVQYADKDMQNRNYIKTQQGKLLLSVPVLLPSFDTPAIDVKINNNQNWRKKHWRSIEMSYAKSKYFSNYKDFFQDVYQKEWESLVDLNIEIIRFMANAFGLETKILRSSEMGIAKHKNEQLVEICHKSGADAFVSGAFAAEAYLDHGLFGKNGIELFVHDFTHPEYPQQHGEFIPRLSAVDLLFNCGRDGFDVIAQGGASPYAKQ